MRKVLTSPRWMTPIVLVLLYLSGSLMAQFGGLNQAGGVSSTVTANQGGNWSVRLQDGSGTVINSTGNALNVNVASGALGAGSAVIGYIRYLPPGCSTLTSDVVHDTVGVATGGGTSVSSVTGCVLSGYVNNITNSPVTLRLADKTGTPIVWVGGNADFTVPANSNMSLSFLAGITMTSGITAIAGSASALNLHLVTRE